MDDYIRGRARKTVCAFAKDAPEARELMCMLGIYFGQEEDEDDGRPLRKINQLNYQ